MKLSKREILLLFVLAIVAVLFIGLNYMILPLNRTNIEKQSTIQGLQEQLSTVEVDVGQKDTVDAQIVQEQEKAAELAKPFLKSIDQEEVDVFITGLLEQNNLALYSIVYTEMSSTVVDYAAEKIVPESQKVQPSIQYTADSITGGSEQTAAASAQTDTAAAETAADGTVTADDSMTAATTGAAAGDVYCTQIILNATGTYADIARFMDKLYSGGRSLVVDSLSISDFEKGGKMAVVVVRFLGVPLLDDSSLQTYSFPAPAGQDVLMKDAEPSEPAPSPTASDEGE